MLEELLIIHGLVYSEQRLERDRETLEMVGLRVAIDRATVLQSAFMVADESISILDVSIRTWVLDLMRNLIDKFHLGGLYISSLIQHICDQTAIMYLGRIVQRDPTETVATESLHPYSQALLRAVPEPDIDQGGPVIMLEGEAARRLSAVSLGGTPS